MFELIQEWWLGFQGDPSLLFSVRIVSAMLAIITAAIGIWNITQPNELERTWTPETRRRFAGIARLRTSGFVLLALYLMAAGVLEADRTSSPNRLLVANGALAVLLLGNMMWDLAWRNHYKLKRAVAHAQGEDVVIK